MIERRRRSFRLPLMLLAALTASASLPAAAEEDPFAGALFPPEVVLRQMAEIELDAAQVSVIKEEVRKAQSFFLDRQLDLQAELGKLRKMIEPSAVDESGALAQLDRILAIERDIKRTQVGLLVRIKNALRPEQQRRLQALSGPR